jgi:hypothetical protein
MSVSINGTNGLVFNDGSAQTTSPFTGGFAMRNRIINGDFRIDQRNAGASLSVPNATLAYGVDRTLVYEDTGASSCTVQQVTDAPSGFVNSLKFTVGTGSTATSAQLAVAEQRIEGFNFADSAYGTASAKTFTLSFWVKSSLTGTYCVGLRNSSDNRSYVATYTINSASTWEFKTITIAGDTSGTWGTGNGIGISLRFDLGSGSNYQTSTLNSWQTGLLFSNSSQANLIGTSSATWQITGWQLEKGSTATSFDYRPYGTELALCQRYYYKFTGNLKRFSVGYNSGTTTSEFNTFFPVSMRTSPTALEQSGTAADYRILHNATSTICSAVPSFGAAYTEGAWFTTTVASGLTTGQASQIRFESASAYLGWSAEL